MRLRTFLKLTEAKLYHGTPNEVQGEFSTDYMGTGEDAQSYGWGLYFAEEPMVAKAYADALGGEHGKIYAIEIRDEILNEFVSWRDPVDVSVIEKILEAQGMSVMQARQAYAEFEKLSSVTADYPADGPDKMAMLDAWDKERKRMDVQMGNMLDELAKPIGTFGHDPKIHQNGQQLYTSLSRSLGGDRQASEFLNSIGVPGIKFLDAESRDGSKRTFNYVVFDGSVTRNLGQVSEW